MKLTQSKKVGEIMRPVTEGIPSSPWVSMADPIMRAIELMLKNDTSRISVYGPQGPVGHIRLEDALSHLGLRLSASPSGSSLHGPANKPGYLKNGQ